MSSILAAMSISLIVVLLGIASGLYLRDGQNDYKSECPLGKRFHYFLAGLSFATAIGVGTVSILNF